MPDVATYRAAISVCEKGQQHRPAVQLSRAVQRHAIVPDVIAYSAPVSALAKRGLQHQWPYISYVRCGAMPPCRMW